MIRFMICDMIRDPVRDPVRDRIRDPVRDAIRNPIRSDPSFVWIPVSNCSSLNKKNISLGGTQHAKKARELYTNKAIIHVQKKKKKRQRQIIKHGDEKEHILITKYMYRSSFKQIFPLQQSCDWTILPVALRTKTFRKRWGSSALIEKLIEASNQNEKIRQTLDKLTYVSLKNTTFIESFGPLIVVVGGRTVFTSKIYRNKRIQMRAFIIAEATLRYANLMQHRIWIQR